MESVEWNLAKIKDPLYCNCLHILYSLDVGLEGATEIAHEITILQANYYQT